MFPRRHGKQWLIAGWSASLLLAACGREPGAQPPLLPNLAPEAAELLDHPDAGAFGRWAAGGSAERLLDLRAELLDAVHAAAPQDSLLQVRRQAALSRVDATLGDLCGLPGYAAETAALASLPPDSAVAARQRVHRIQEVFADPDLEPAAKLERMARLQDLLLAADHWDAAADAWYAMAPLQQDRRDPSAWTGLHRRGLALAREHDLLPAACRAWGQLMMANMQRGWTPAERDTLRQLQERARGARLARTSAYLITLQGYDAFNQGRYATARALFEDGIAVCRELGDPAQALATMDVLLRMYGVFECWDQVDLLLERARCMRAERATERSLYAGRELAAVRHASLTARSLAAHGRLDEAHAAFSAAFAAAERLPYAEADYLGQHWFSAMMEHDRPDLAAGALATIGRSAERRDAGPINLRLPLWRAWLAWRTGDRDGAVAALDRFASLAQESNPLLLANLGFQQAALQARVLAPAAPDSAAAVLAAGWRDLRIHVAEREAGPEAYLDLARNGHLRAAAHDILGGDPETDYGLELLWRRTFLPRRAATADGEPSDLAAAAQALAEQAGKQLAARGAVHCVYQVQHDRVVRWTADGAGVARAVLASPPADLRARVAGVLEQLGRDPGGANAAVPPELAQALAVLAREILPPQVLDPARRPRALFVSGDGFLAQIPFSPLNLDPEGYRPLVACMDVAWLRGGPVDAGGAAPPGSRAQALVVADPALDAATRRRFALPAGLPGAAAELAGISGRLPAARVLTGDRATRMLVRQEWESAEVIYFVGHAVREAEVPFSSWLPLAPADEHDVYPGLDLADVLSARLDRCRLVVLSGCATGAPYVDGLSVTPSLGDAFLDAGAEAVIQTFWRVRDEGSAVQPQRILAAWQDEGLDLAAAVSAERRRALQGPDGIRHPFDWAAWTLKSAWLPAAPTPAAP